MCALDHRLNLVPILIVPMVVVAVAGPLPARAQASSLVASQASAPAERVLGVARRRQPQPSEQSGSERDSACGQGRTLVSSFGLTLAVT